MVMRRRRALAAAAALVAAGAGTATWVWGQARAPSVEVGPGPVAARVVARATIVPRDGVAEVRGRVDGRVLRVLVSEGERVAAGQLLAELESTALQAEVARADAEQRAAEAAARLVGSGSRSDEIALARAEVQAARAEWQRAQDHAARAAALAETHAIPAEASQDAAGAAQMTRAKLDAAEARLRLVVSGSRSEDIRAARERAAAAEASRREAADVLERARLVAPIEGAVLARRIDPGDTVVGSLALVQAPLFEIADIGHTEVRVEVEEVDSARVAIGQVVTLRGLDGEPIGAGHVVRIAARCERRTIDVDPAIVRADGLVRPMWLAWDGPAPARPIGQRLEASIELLPRQVTSRVPRRAVRVEDGAAMVRVKDGWRVRARAVVLGAADDDWVEVAGVAPGERVVVEGG
jgi:multidrug resistance efflux pump